MGERDFLTRGGLAPSVCWAMTRLAGASAHSTILDPCVGRGGLLVEAALLQVLLWESHVQTHACVHVCICACRDAYSLRWAGDEQMSRRRRRRRAGGHCKGCGARCRMRRAR